MATPMHEAAARVPARRQRQVRRYARMVRWFKVLLPLAGVLLVVAIFLSSRDRGDVTDLLTAEELARLGAGLKLENPRFSGVTENGEDYTLRARTALPDGANPKRIGFEGPSGEMVLGDGRVLAAEANTGDLDRARNLLTLTGDVRLSTSDGYRFSGERLVLDLKQNTAVSDSAVAGDGPTGEIQAGSFRAARGPGGSKDTTLWFENGVRVVFIPSEDK